ncbi:cupredoxin family protein [Cupriavidus necator]|uniref:cupredoxin family protein n=1 Tax=Cupriavidus necator TaxID=106590 RepID=UPI0039C335C0
MARSRKGVSPRNRSPQQIAKAGDTVRFVVRDIGKAEHEMVIGTSSELREHAHLMRDMPMARHAAANQVSLAPGQQGVLIWRFDRSGTVGFACLLPGHYEAGMVGKVTVELQRNSHRIRRGALLVRRVLFRDLPLSDCDFLRPA